MTTLRITAAPRQANQSRTFRIIKAPTQNEPGSVRLTVNGEQSDYQFSFCHVADAMGLCAVGILKTAGEQPYHVRVDKAGHGECDCLGFLRWGHCRHADLAPMLIWQLGRMAAEQGAIDSATTIVVRNGEGEPLVEIVSPSGIARSHRKLAECLSIRPHLLSNAEQIDAMAQSITGTQIRVLPRSNEQASKLRNRIAASEENGTRPEDLPLVRD